MQLQSSTIDFTGQNIYVGFDVHLKSWKVTILSDEISHKTFTQPPEPEVLHNYLLKNFPGGIYHSAYEAGFCGYWIHYRLLEFGINSIVVNPADIPTTNKEKVQKDDKRDSRKIARALRNGDLTPIKFRMEQMNLKQTDVAPLFGGKTRVSEVLNGKRNLTLKMITLLNRYLGIPLESLMSGNKEIKLDDDKKEKLLHIPSIREYWSSERAAVI